MQLSEDEVKLIAKFVNSAAKASSMEVVVNEAFKTLNAINPIDSIRVVFPFDHGSWCDWQSSGKGAAMTRSDERPASSRRSLTVALDSESNQAGFISLTPRRPEMAFAVKTLAPSLWTTVLLQAALERVQKAALSETELVRATMRARDEERRRIARELHDDLGQSMASLKLNLKWVEDIARRKGLEADVVKELSDSRDAVGEMLTKIRDLSHTLYPRILDTLGLFAAVKELAFQVGRHSTLKVLCKEQGKERPLEKEVGVALYRCCQESVSNVIRHAEASRIEIHVHYKKTEVCVTVEDNGRGFDPRTLYDRSGKMMSSGFWTIRQRMADLGGAFRLSTAKGRGTVLEMMVPYSLKGDHAKRKNKNTHRG
jgi:signal transduction histidine kinase